MRGSDTKQASMLCLISPEARVPAEHPLRAIKKLADEALKGLSPVLDETYAASPPTSSPHTCSAPPTTSCASPSSLVASLLLLAACAHAPAPTATACPHPHDGTAHGGHAHEGGSGSGHDSAANAHMHRVDFPALVARFEDPARAAWQKPDDVLALLGPLRGKVVADLGAGTGYFTVRLLEAAQKVVATDVDERFLAYLRGRVSASPHRDKLVLRLVGTDRPGLVPEEADLALVVDVFHHVEDRVGWLRALAAGLRPGGEVVIIDFKPGDFSDAPPASMRLPVETVVRELESAGFDKPRTDETTLPRQYVVRAVVRAP